jgi:tight adherence protein B
MSGTIVALVGVTVFVALQAMAALVTSRAARRRAALRLRLGIPVREEPLLRGATNAVDALLQSSGLGWSPGGLMARALLWSAALGVGGATLLGSGGLVLALSGPLLLYLRLTRARARRLADVDQQMPRVLELMALALRAGHPFARALALVTDELPAPIGPELRRVVEELQLGRRLDDALLALRDRLAGSLTVRTLVVSVVVLHKTGGNLVEVIDRMRETLEAQAQYRLRLRAVTAESRLSSRMVMGLPLVFGGAAALANRAFGRLFVESAGQALLLLAAILWLLGVVWVQRLVRPEV